MFWIGSFLLPAKNCVLFCICWLGWIILFHPVVIAITSPNQLSKTSVSTRMSSRKVWGPVLWLTPHNTCWCWRGGVAFPLALIFSYWSSPFSLNYPIPYHYLRMLIFLVLRNQRMVLTYFMFRHQMVPYTQAGFVTEKKLKKKKNC